MRTRRSESPSSRRRFPCTSGMPLAVAASPARVQEHDHPVRGEKLQIEIVPVCRGLKREAGARRHPGKPRPRFVHKADVRGIRLAGIESNHLESWCGRLSEGGRNPQISRNKGIEFFLNGRSILTGSAQPLRAQYLRRICRAGQAGNRKITHVDCSIRFAGAGTRWPTSRTVATHRGPSAAPGILPGCLRPFGGSAPASWPCWPAVARVHRQHQPGELSLPGPCRSPCLPRRPMAEKWRRYRHYLQAAAPGRAHARRGASRTLLADDARLSLPFLDMWLARVFCWSTSCLAGRRCRRDRGFLSESLKFMPGVLRLLNREHQLCLVVWRLPSTSVLPARPIWWSEWM